MLRQLALGEITSIVPMPNRVYSKVNTAIPDAGGLQKSYSSSHAASAFFAHLDIASLHWCSLERTA